MNAPCVLPTVENAAKVFGDLFGRELEVKKSTTLQVEQPGLVGTYVNDDGELVALVVCDVEFACNAGAALAMIPPDVAKGSIKQATIEDDLLENTREILNIASRLFNYAGTNIHVALKDVHLNQDPLTEDVIELIKRPIKRLDLDFDVEGYGPGRFILFAR